MVYYALSMRITAKRARNCTTSQTCRRHMRPRGANPRAQTTQATSPTHLHKKIIPPTPFSGSIRTSIAHANRITTARGALIIVAPSRRHTRRPERINRASTHGLRMKRRRHAVLLESLSDPPFVSRCGRTRQPICMGSPAPVMPAPESQQLESHMIFASASLCQSEGMR